jgi:hypothetical protein
MKAHTTGDCGERIDVCSWCYLGCPVRVKQAALPVHEAEASGEHLILAREAILAQQNNAYRGIMPPWLGVTILNHTHLSAVWRGRNRSWCGTRSRPDCTQR